MMRIDKYIALAKFYNISLDYLTGIMDTPRPLFENYKPKGTPITKDGLNIIKNTGRTPALKQL